MRFTLISLLLSLSALQLSAQTPVLVLTPSPTPSEHRAAQVLQFYLGKITGQNIVQTSAKPGRKQRPIFVGKIASARAFGLSVPEKLPNDATYLQGKNGAFVIAGGGEMGAEYAAYSLLELLGCRKYSPRDSFIPDIKNLQLPDYQAKIETPAFPYRELWYEPAFDAAWTRWHKLITNPEKQEAWGMFVHTFQHLCPEKTWFAAHPEYFAWNGAQRSPGQLCLSNDTVLQVVIEALRAKIKEKPTAKYWSVSQNDNYDYCKCPRCAAADKRYGSPAGTLLAFVNKVAAAFPDKTISTLAYQYTRQAPHGIKPADNVSVCLCSIECNRGKSIEEGCTDFAGDVRAWSALTSNLMIWDYVVQFRSYVSPFPNWHTLQPNLRFFKKNGVRMMFEQGSGHSRSEFSDMRAYLLAKLMWNPEANVDSILADFRKGYYGPAAPMIKTYIDQLTGRLLESDRWLGIYATPQVEAHSFLDDLGILTDFKVLREAIQATPENSAEQAHARAALLPVMFASLEQEKIKNFGYFVPDSNGGYVHKPLFREKELQQFVDACKEAGYETLHEMNYTPEQYMIDYLQDTRNLWVWHSFVQFIHPDSEDDAVDVTIQSSSKASATYEKGNLKKLIDGKRGTNDYHYNWLGFQGQDLDVTLKMTDTKQDKDLPEVSSISVQFLQDQASWVFFPEKVQLAVSADGQLFTTVKETDFKLEPDGKKSVRRIEAAFPKQKVRAVRVMAISAKTCPTWHTCNGNPCWIFADEVVVK
jgi:hypothetical protein